MTNRKRIFEVIEIAQDKNSLSSIYDYIMMAAIIVSLIPLMFKGTNRFFDVIDKITVSVFILDYLLRLLTADFKLGKGVASFFSLSIFFSCNN